MSKSNTKKSKKHSKHRRERHCNKGNWSPTNIFAMIFAFIVAWPIGLFILFWICSGRNVGELFTMAKSFWVKHFGADDELSKYGEPANTNNVVFNEYQATQYDRVREIKEEIKERTHRFYDYRSDAKRRADEQEFNEFMSNGPVIEG